jgi:hypothetical protein
MLSAGFLRHSGIFQAENGEDPSASKLDHNNKTLSFILLETKRTNDGFWVSFAELPHDSHIAQ